MGSTPTWLSSSLRNLNGIADIWTFKRAVLQPFHRWRYGCSERCHGAGRRILSREVECGGRIGHDLIRWNGETFLPARRYFDIVPIAAVVHRNQYGCSSKRTHGRPERSSTTEVKSNLEEAGDNVGLLYGLQLALNLRSRTRRGREQCHSCDFES